MSFATDTKERLQEEMTRGESSLDVAGRVCWILKQKHPNLSSLFAVAYEKYANDDIEIDTGLLHLVNEVLDNSEELEDPRKQRDNEIQSLMDDMDGIKI